MSRKRGAGKYRDWITEGGLLKKEIPLYCDVIIKRWETFTGKKAEKIA